MDTINSKIFLLKCLTWDPSVSSMDRILIDVMFMSGSFPNISYGPLIL